ncbi:glycosyltransferase family 2 protein [Parafrankia sp. BMG5.11]|uniref:glycosyltransferase family 2 protein n=1 Tax=Parafrankia sp. BMG5.11 TaxID=222540 RepID=UPI00103E7F13|nr:glycosyltransferase family 2 protein [Parafrankia sp. BMG5.11]TCJ32805.1 glycosyltransferase family 2 protein [Parafrankia sp. BMG5.11]
MKLIIQIPCFNECDTLPQTLGDLPSRIDGIDIIEYLVIDDGSSDETAELARQLGVHHVLRNTTNLGLARSFARGIDFALGAGADIIVNTDGDNQYYGGDIAKLVEPIIRGEAEIVIGDRQTAKIEHFSPGKKLLQSFGSSVVRTFSGVQVPDAVSGFRAISRHAAMQLNIVSSFSYTIEMLIQAGKKSMAVASTPVRTNPKTRESRLFKSVFRFIERSGTTAIRMYAMYQPLRIFSLLGALIAVVGMMPIIRFLYFYFFVGGSGKIQSLVIGSALLTVGSITFVMGLLADLVGRNRQLMEMTLERVRRLDLEFRNRDLRGGAPLPSRENLSVQEKLKHRGDAEHS